MLDTITRSVDDRSARGIAVSISRLITSGSLPVGSKLPTVRQLSRRLGVSPTTVGEAWRALADIGAIETLGRNGTIVRQPTGPGSPRRYRKVVADPDNAGHFAIDLSTGTPDPGLLPDLRPALAKVSSQDLTGSYLDHAVLPELESRLRVRWPFEPEELTVVDGAMDALDRILGVVAHLGDRVVVEDPCFPPVLDLLDQMGVEIIGVPVDDEGLDLAALEEAMRMQPVAIILQPRAQNPTGVTMTAERARRVARTITESPVADRIVVIEDDHAGDIAVGELVSIGCHLPDRTVHVRSYSKSHGPDLRLAAVGGNGAVVSSVANRRLLGPGWSSRILQSVLLELLDDPSTITSLGHARAEYARRRRDVVDRLHAAGVVTTGTDGINLWVRVTDERSALLALAARGIGAAPGQPFALDERHPSIRVTVGLLADDGQRAEVAETLVMAANTSATSRRGQR